VTVEPDRTGIVFVIAAPSGTGKSTVTRRLLREVPDLAFSVSYTTRAPRDGERNGEHYHFVDREAFDGLAREGALLERAEVHGQLYGTGLEATRAALSRGVDMLLDIDVHGARQVRASAFDSVSIMILPPDFAALEERLAGRGSEGRAERALRLSRARDEATSYLEFDYLVVNRRLDATLDEVVAILKAERRRARRCQAEARRVLSSFPA
jgi:guanylate kinase